MALRLLVGGLMLVAFGAEVRGDEKAVKASDGAATNLERMKKLAGTWVEADKDGKPTDKVVSVIKVTAGGSAVQETLFPGQAMEMVSIYHLDKGDLVMTHYCMLGNQPRHEGRRQVAGQRDPLPLRRWLELRSEERHAHARGDAEVHRCRSHRVQRPGLGGWQASHRSLRHDEAHPQEIGMKWEPSCALALS